MSLRCRVYSVEVSSSLLRAAVSNFLFLKAQNWSPSRLLLPVCWWFKTTKQTQLWLDGTTTSSFVCCYEWHCHILLMLQVGTISAHPVSLLWVSASFLHQHALTVTLCFHQRTCLHVCPVSLCAADFVCVSLHVCAGEYECVIYLCCLCLLVQQCQPG